MSSIVVQLREVEGHAVRRVAHVISCRDGDVVLLWVKAIRGRHARHQHAKAPGVWRRRRGQARLERRFLLDTRESFTLHMPFEATSACALQATADACSAHIFQCKHQLYRRKEWHLE